MKKKSTKELEDILQHTHPSAAGEYLDNEKEFLYNEMYPFAGYMNMILKNKKLQKQQVFLNADIPLHYGYKILSEEKHTKQRDVIIRICYGADMSLEETQRALRLYNMSPLYAKIPRDAVLMIAFNTHPGDISDVNELLRNNNLDELKSIGNMD